MTPDERMARLLHPSNQDAMRVEARTLLDRVFPPEECDEVEGRWIGHKYVPPREEGM